MGKKKKKNELKRKPCETFLGLNLWARKKGKEHWVIRL